MVARHDSGNTVNEGASMVVIRRDAVLMVQRAREPAKGLWSFPAGRREPDEDAEANARRELLEETGLVVGPVAMLGHFSPPGAPPGFRLTVFAARAAAAGPVAGDDAARAEFVPFAQVLSRRTTKGAAGWIARAVLALVSPPLI